MKYNFNLLGDYEGELKVFVSKIKTFENN